MILTRLILPRLQQRMAAGTFGGWVRERKKKSVSEPSDAAAPSIRFGTGSKRSKPRAHWKLEQLMINYIDMRAHAIEEEGNNLDLTWEYVEFKARELAPKVTAPRRHNVAPRRHNAALKPACSSTSNHCRS